MPATTVIKLRRGTASQWTSANPVLAAGEMGIETDTNKFKFGNGTNPWSTLSYGVAAASGGASVDWADVLNKPATFPPSSHTHSIDDIEEIVISGTPADNELLAYDTTSGDWINQTAAEAGLATVSDLTPKLTNPMTTAGDLIVGGASGAGTRLAIGAAGRVLSSNGTSPSWTELPKTYIYSVPPLSFVEIDTSVFEAGQKYWAVTAGNGTVGLRLYDSSDVEIGTVNSISTQNEHFTWPANVAYGVIQSQNSVSLNEVVFRKIENTTPVVSQRYQIITTTQSVTLDASYDAYLIGGGGAGGGIPSGIESAGSGGGGSGYYTTGILTAGTYTATIGAGAIGNAVDGVDGPQGGTTSIGALSAAGGFGGKAPTVDAVGGAGGAGGSGGGGGVGSTVQLLTNNVSGALGGNGQAGQTGTGGTAGAGGTGSGVTPPNPLSLYFQTLLDPADTGVTTSASGVGSPGLIYAGGSGGGVDTTTSRGGDALAASYGAGGGGTRGDSTATAAIRGGGNGAPGVIILIERV